MWLTLPPSLNEILLSPSIWMYIWMYICLVPAFDCHQWLNCPYFCSLNTNMKQFFTAIFILFLFLQWKLSLVYMMAGYFSTTPSIAISPPASSEGDPHSPLACGDNPHFHHGHEVSISPTFYEQLYLNESVFRSFSTSVLKVCVWRSSINDVTQFW